MKIEQTILFERNIPESFSFEFSIPGYTCFRLDVDNLTRLREIWPVDLKTARKRMHRGDLCFVAADHQGVVHYSWAQVSGMHYIGPAGRMARVKAHEIWIYHCRTAEQARGKGIYPAVLNAIMAEAKTADIQRALIYTTETNIASQKGIAKAGFVPKAFLYAFRLGQITIPWVKF